MAVEREVSAAGGSGAAGCGTAGGWVRLLRLVTRRETFRQLREVSGAAGSGSGAAGSGAGWGAGSGSAATAAGAGAGSGFDAGGAAGRCDHPR
ncbi:hypothetical protein ABTY61_36175 [Kitasatospora sp. NPDC096128]|uniref:hypothetical protein n=1 Tax=Kitasatospora sp. NPDC096128 TaxID=3155547 RepID=UPI0033343BCE